MHRFSAFWHMRLPHRLQDQKSKLRVGGILWRPPSRTACYTCVVLNDGCQWNSSSVPLAWYWMERGASWAYFVWTWSVSCMIIQTRVNGTVQLENTANFSYDHKHCYHRGGSHTTHRFTWFVCTSINSFVVISWCHASMVYWKRGTMWAFSLCPTSPHFQQLTLGFQPLQTMPVHFPFNLSQLVTNTQMCVCDKLFHTNLSQTDKSDSSSKDLQFLELV